MTELLPDLSSRESVIQYVGSVFVQLFVFLFAMLAINLLILKPIRKILKARGSNLESLDSELSQMNEQNNMLQEDYKLRMEGVRQLETERRDNARSLAKQQASAIISGTKREAGKDLNNVIKNMDDSYKHVAMSIEASVSGFTKAITDKIINT